MNTSVFTFIKAVMVVLIIFCHDSSYLPEGGKVLRKAALLARENITFKKGFYLD